MPYFLKASFGNDSIALIQFIHEIGLANDGVIVIYSDTGWAHKNWPKRVAQGQDLCREYGMTPVTLESEGFENLARRKGFPRQGMQFCTEKLKILPSQEFMDVCDPAKDFIVIVGKRREESVNRRETPEFIVDHDIDGGRTVWHAIVTMGAEERNEYVRRAGFDPLPHRSRECYPCINSNRSDLRQLDAERVDYIEALENSLGLTSKGKPRTFFRPYRYMGATGIREMKRWADSDPGKFSMDDGTGDDDNECYSGQCGL